jgi:formylglycine-generating enzyme required for sulfatase activity
LAAFAGLGIAGWAKFDALVVYKSWTADRFSSQVLSPEKELALAPAASFAECSYCPVMVVVPAGTFVMGSPPEETPANRRFYDNERPQHQVVIEQPFAVGRFEVTFEQWDACYYLGGCTTRPGDEGWGRGNQPVVNINWDDAKQYVAWLSRQTGKPYRLLTESEWEYAARAGTQTPYAFGTSIDGKANCDGCGSRWDNERTAPVGSFAANAFGLHDMHGNVWELVEDCYRDSYQGAPSNSATVHVEGCRDHVVRGGSFYNFKLNVRTAVRTRWHAGASKADVLDPDDPDTPAKAMGLRIARTLLVKR